MSEYWLISAPGEETCQQTFEKLNNVTSKQNNLSINYRFNVPDLKVGTLDQLVGLSDDLAKLDIFVEGVTRKLASYLGELLEDQRDKVSENLQVNGGDLATYVTRFNWDKAKYPVRQSLSGIADIINKQVSQIDADLKVKAAQYNQLKSSLQNLERKSSGSLLLRSLGDLVKREQFVLGSEFLTTLLVVVPKSITTEWENSYETISEYVVPRSSKRIYEDNEHCLYNVTLFQRDVNDFKTHAREKKFIVRDFKYSEDELTAGKTEQAKLKSDKAKQLGSLFRWIKVNFGEAFSAWIHVKALRVFVESVLRYGLPVNFQAMLLQPVKSHKKLREVLNKLYSHLDTSIAQGPVDEEHQQKELATQIREDPTTVCGIQNHVEMHFAFLDIPGLGLGQQEYYPYVYFKISIDMGDVGHSRS